MVSDTIADTANMHTGHFNYLSLGSQDRLWAETLINTGENKRRFADIEFVRAAGYDINEAASKLQKFYLSIVTNM